MAVRVQPRASRDQLVGWRGETLALRVTAPPVGGAANRAVAALLAAELGVPPSAVSIVRGDRGRDKLVRVAGLSRQQVQARLAGPGGGRR